MTRPSAPGKDAKEKDSPTKEASDDDMPTLEKGDAVQQKEDSDDDDVPELEDNLTAPNATGKPGNDASPEKAGEGGHGKQSKNEKKARALLLKLGLKPVPGITRAAIRKTNLTFVINNPDVYKHPYSDHYIIFGEAKVEETDHNEALSHLKAMERIRQLNLSDPDANESGPMSRAGDLGLAKSKIEEEPEEEEGEVDETGVDSGDVNLVMAQSGATRRQAVNALKKHGGDVVNAIMEMTS